MSQVVTFGEIMLRLSPPGYQRLVQARSFDVTYGGGEANVAIALASFGVEVAYVTCLPRNELGQSAAHFLRQHGVDISYVSWVGKRLGIYWLENGSSQRASKVVYDRAGSSISEVSPGSIDWRRIFRGGQWFHWTGITPAISASAAEVCREACQMAKECGLTVSCDLNYRKKLWGYGKTASEVMPGLVNLADLVIGNEEDADQVFGIQPPRTDVEQGRLRAEDYRHVGEKLMERFPTLRQVAITLRGSLSASHNTWGGVLFDGKELHVSRIYDIHPIVDRVGAGDSFAAGLIFSILKGRSGREAIEFAVAASCLKHTIPGDCNLVSIEEVEGLMKGSGSGRVQR
ncbi:MAG: sugar kinase [Planctomycetes bacterium]|nr:sugar kinase [Planctomycetota bacterium]